MKFKETNPKRIRGFFVNIWGRGCIGGDFSDYYSIVEADFFLISNFLTTVSAL